MQYSSMLSLSGFSLVRQVDLTGPSSVSVVNIAVLVVLSVLETWGQPQRLSDLIQINTSWVLDAHLYLMFYGLAFQSRHFLEKLLSSFEGFCCEILCLLLWVSASFHP